MFWGSLAYAVVVSSAGRSVAGEPPVQIAFGQGVRHIPDASGRRSADIGHRPRGPCHDTRRLIADELIPEVAALAERGPPGMVCSRPEHIVKRAEALAPIIAVQVDLWLLLAAG